MDHPHHPGDHRSRLVHTRLPTSRRLTRVIDLSRLPGRCRSNESRGLLSRSDGVDEAIDLAVAPYEDVYKLSYVRGPSGIIVMLAEELKKS